jgi:serine/threonine-protein kinase
VVTGSTSGGQFSGHSSAVIDPSPGDGSCALTAQQYFATDGTWATRLARACGIVTGTVVPNLIGDTPSGATGALAAVGLFFGNLTFTTDCAPATDRKDHVISTNPVAGTPVPFSARVDEVICEAVQVPDLIGNNATYDSVLLVNVGLEADLAETASCPLASQGLVVDSSPYHSGDLAIIGSTVTLVVCHITSVTVPDVTNESRADATADIQAAGLTVGSVGFTTSCDVLPGTVADQGPLGGDVAPIGSSVSLRISTGRPRTPCN